MVFSVQKDNRPLPRIPSNGNVQYDQIKSVTLDDLSIDEQHVYVTQNTFPHPLPFNLTTEVFTSIGYIPYTELTDCIPSQKVKSYVEFDADRISWTAPKNIPIGSLTHRLLGFFYQAEMYSLITEAPYELQYYIGNTTPLVLQKKLHEKGIAIDDVFFSNLELALKNLHNPLYNETAELEFYRDIFIHNNGVTPSEEEKEIFTQVILGMQKEVAERVLSKSFYFSTDSSQEKSTTQNSEQPELSDERPRFLS